VDRSAGRLPSVTGDGETVTWLHVATRRVVASFLDALARSHGWQRLFIVSPWISDFTAEGGIAFSQLLKRLSDDDATAYVVSRPPIEGWHRSALDRIAATGKANIALVPSLHTKLYCADTDQGAFALVASANFTEQSLANREIGVLIRSSGAGRQIVRKLMNEASDIYRSSDRQLMCQRRFSTGA